MLGFASGDEAFLAELGLQETLPFLERSGRSTYTSVVTDLNTGDLRSLMFRIIKTKNGYRIKTNYFFHKQQEKSQIVKFLDLRFTRQGDKLVLEKASREGMDLPVTEDLGQSLRPFIKRFFEHVSQRSDWLNPVALMEEYGLSRSGIGIQAWPGLYLNGDLKRDKNPGVRTNNYKPVYSALFLPALLGVGPDSYSNKKESTHVLVHYGTGARPSSTVLEYKYQQGKTPLHIKIKARIAAHDTHHVEEEDVLYEIETRPLAPFSGEVEIKKLRYMGYDIDLTNPRAVAVTLETIRKLNRTIRAGDRALVNDLKRPPHERHLSLPSEVMIHTNLYEHLNHEVKMPREGIMSFTVPGGNNLYKLVSDHEINIGANQYVLTYESMSKSGVRQKESIMIDAGVLFHDRFDVAFFNASRYFYHKYDKSHVPEEPVKAILFTHRHKDHLGQLAYLVKAGYQLPPLVMNAMSYEQLKRDMTELDIDRKVKEEVLNLCHIIDINRDINPSNPDERKVYHIGGTRLEQWTEVLPGKRLGGIECYPRMKIGNFEIRVGPMPHSDPGFMYDIITPAGSHRHTGDSKMEDDDSVALPSLEIWLKGFQPDSMSIDSTNANKEGKNTTEADVRATITHDVQANPDKRFIISLLGSNLARLQTVVEALGQTHCKTLLFDGKATQDLERDANKAHAFIAWAKREHGITVIKHTRKQEVARILKEGAVGSYALIATGTQDEPFSSINRAARDCLPDHRYQIGDNDILYVVQGVIPVRDNARRRASLKDFVESFHGVKVMMPEFVRHEEALLSSGKQRIMHSSGHGCQENNKQTMIWSGCPHILPVHGGPEQLQANQETAHSVGAPSTIIPCTMSVRIQKGKKVSLYKRVNSSYIGIYPDNLSPDKFYLKGRFSNIVMPVPPSPQVKAERLMEVFERAIRQASGKDSDYKMAYAQSLLLSPIFNAFNLNGFLAQGMAFGIERYRKGNVFADKKIHVVAGFDVETTGKNCRHHRITEAGVIAQDAETRETLETLDLQQAMPEHIVPSPAALLITRKAPGDDISSGIQGPLFSKTLYDRLKNLKTLAKTIAQKKGSESNKQKLKILMVAHNAPFDSRFLEKEFGRSLFTSPRPHKTDGLLAVDTLQISRALCAYGIKGYNVPTREITIKGEKHVIPDHRLGSLCKANGIEHDENAAHGASYDAQACLKLFWAQYDSAPELVSQMVVNADKATSHLLNDMRGANNGFDGPHPVFSYTSQVSLRYKPQMGCFLGTLDSGRYAVIFNLKYDPHEYLNLSAKDIQIKMEDRNCDVFEIVDLSKNPIIVPAKFGSRAGARGPLAHEILDKRAGIVKRHLNYVDPHCDWQTISQKLQASWEKGRKKIYKSRLVSASPDLQKPASERDRLAPIPEDGIAHMQRIRGNIGTNIIFRNFCEDFKHYADAVQRCDFDEARKLYGSVIRHRGKLGAPAQIHNYVKNKHIATVVDVINNVHYDIGRADMHADDVKRIECMREYIRNVQYGEAEEEIKFIESNPAEYERLIGQDKEKEALFQAIKEFMYSHEGYKTLSEQTKCFIHSGRKASAEPEAPVLKWA